ncbi:MAG: hypothetical protein ACLVJ6_17155 [Merdibacter sp.]
MEDYPGLYPAHPDPKPIEEDGVTYGGGTRIMTITRAPLSRRPPTGNIVTLRTGAAGLHVECRISSYWTVSICSSPVRRASPHRSRLCQCPFRLMQLFIRWPMV